MSSNQEKVLPKVGEVLVNELGGAYVNGRALPKNTRMQILQMAAEGARSVDISRDLKVTHGCVSKIIRNYIQTGSILPGVTVRQSVSGRAAALIKEYLDEDPAMLCWDIQDRLKRDGGIEEKAVPSMIAISKHLRDRDQRDDGAESPLSTTGSETSADQNFVEPVLVIKRKERKPRTVFTEQQMDVLETSFQTSQYPARRELEALEKLTCLNKDQLSAWFSNRRAKVKKQGATILPKHKPPTPSSHEGHPSMYTIEWDQAHASFNKHGYVQHQFNVPYHDEYAQSYSENYDYQDQGHYEAAQQHVHAYQQLYDPQLYYTPHFEEAHQGAYSQSAAVL